MKGDIDTSAVTVNSSAEESHANKESDEEVTELLDTETGVELFVVDKNATRAGDTCLKCLSLASLTLGQYGLFQHVDRTKPYT